MRLPVRYSSRHGLTLKSILSSYLTKTRKHNDDNATIRIHDDCNASARLCDDDYRILQQYDDEIAIQFRVIDLSSVYCRVCMCSPLWCRANVIALTCIYYKMCSLLVRIRILTLNTTANCLICFYPIERRKKTVLLYW